MALAPITDYDSLVAAVSAMADRTDVEYTNSIPLFIQQAETRLFRHLRCPGNEARGTYLATAADNTVGILIPLDYLECKLLYYGEQPLERVSDQRISTLLAQDQVAAPPAYFARVVDQIVFYPRAAANDDVNLIYYEQQGPLSSVGMPWTKMLRIAPFAYLYGALAEGARFTRDSGLLQMWDAQFQQEIDSMNAQAMDNEVAGSTVVVAAMGGGW